MADLFYFDVALDQARFAFVAGEVPVGCVLVDPNGAIVAKGYNTVERAQSQSAHAECLVINQVCQDLGSWRLDGYTIFVTLEPCLMCLGLISLCRIKRLVYGCPSPLFGAFLFVDSQNFSATKNLEVVAGLKAKLSADILKEFFGVARSKKRDNVKE